MTAPFCFAWFCWYINHSTLTIRKLVVIIINQAHIQLISWLKSYLLGIKDKFFLESDFEWNGRSVVLAFLVIKTCFFSGPIKRSERKKLVGFFVANSRDNFTLVCFLFHPWIFHSWWLFIIIDKHGGINQQKPTSEKKQHLLIYILKLIFFMGKGWIKL